MIEFPPPASDATRGVPAATTAAFLAAVFVVEIGTQRWTVTPLDTPDTSTDVHPAGRSAIAILSARNPGGHAGDPEADDAGHAALVGALATARVPTWPALGRSPDHAWTEPSLAVPLTRDTTLATLVPLARRFDQAALAVWTPGHLTTVWTPLAAAPTSDTRPARATPVAG